MNRRSFHLKIDLKKRTAVLAVAAALILATPALALFGKATSVSADAPVAREIEAVTYRNIPYYAQFLATDGDGEDLTFQVKTEPKHGSVKVDGANFVYTPKGDHTGSDSFTYVAKDSSGNESVPATVSVNVKKIKSGVAYSDMSGSSAAAAAQQLAESGIFTGTKIGNQYFFEPDRTVSRSEFLAMTMAVSGKSTDKVTMTGFCDDDQIPAWSKACAAAALSDGLVEGMKTADGVAFRGDQAVTFNEAATILNRALDVNNVNLDAWYADRSAVPSWAAQAVGNMESVSVLASGSFGSGALNNSVTRADAAKMLASAQTLLQNRSTGVFAWLNP
jgi:hypothetical protein